MDHDQRFKVLLVEFFREFFLLVLPEWVGFFDFGRVEWLNQELFINPPQGEKNVLDLLAKLPVVNRSEAQHPGEAPALLALIHVEIESRDSVTAVRARLHETYEQLRRKHRLPVLSIGFFLNVGLGGLGWDVYEEKFLNRVVLHFEYPYIGLPGLNAEEFVTGENVLGVALAAQMRIPEDRRVELRAQAWRRLVECPENDTRRFLLSECLEAYWTLNETQQRQYQELVSTEPYQGARAMAMTLFERRIEQFQRDTERRIEQFQRDTLRKLLEKRFSPLPPKALERLQAIPPERLEELLLAFAEGRSLRELGLED